MGSCPLEASGGGVYQGFPGGVQLGLPGGVAGAGEDAPLKWVVRGWGGVRAKGKWRW